MEASGRQRKEVGMPEVGVASCIEVPDLASVILITQKEYPQSYPHGSGGTLCPLAPLPEQPGAVNESRIRRTICGE